MLSPMMKLKLLQLATKYGIQIVEYRPGYVQVHIARWAQYEHRLNQIIEKIKQYPEITSVIHSRHTNIISIHYDETMFASKSAINYWFNILENEILT